MNPDSDIKDVEEENKSAATANADAIINEFVTDVVPPSPVVIGDSPPSDGKVGESLPPTDNLSGKRGRGRPKKNPDSIQDSKPSSPRPKLSGTNTQTSPGNQSQPIDVQNAGIEPCADLCVLMVNNTGMILGGETAAMNLQESIMAKSGFVSYFKMKGIENVPAWVVLLGALSPYTLRVITATPAKTTISNIFGRTWYRIKEWRKGRKNARTNSRDNSKREINAGEKDSKTSGA